MKYTRCACGKKFSLSKAGMRALNKHNYIYHTDVYPIKVVVKPFFDSLVEDLNKEIKNKIRCNQ